MKKLDIFLIVILLFFILKAIHIWWYRAGDNFWDFGACTMIKSLNVDNYYRCENKEVICYVMYNRGMSCRFKNILDI